MLPSSSACQLTTFFIGVTEVCFMAAPVGHCSYCCPRDNALDIQYKLFTRSRPTSFELITVGDRASLRRTRFNASNPTVIYLIGFTETTSGPSTTTLRDDAHFRSMYGINSYYAILNLIWLIWKTNCSSALRG